MQRALQAFRDGRYEAARQLLARAGQDVAHRPLATSLASRIQGALNAAAAANRPALATTLQGLRDAALQLTRLGHASLALWLDEGVDRLGGAGAPPTRLERDDLAGRVATAQRALLRGRQAAAMRRMMEASRLLAEGLEAEPNRPDLKALQAPVAKELADAEESLADAVRMRRFTGGAVHVLTAIERGLKACADHPQLRALKKEMEAAFEERTAPPVTSAFLAAAKVSTPAAALTEGHRLYTTRCTECHELELLDSRGIAGWQRVVGGMARRAGLTEAEQTRILDYLAAAQNGLPDR
jgi:mono/diheme cytochrome c family protein